MVSDGRNLHPDVDRDEDARASITFQPETGIANKGLVFNGRGGQIRTADPLRPRHR